MSDIKDLTSFATSTAYLGVSIRMLDKSVDMIGRIGKGHRKRKKRRR